jgi:hypothetical protein
MKQRILNLLIALDQFLFSIFTLGKAGPDETASAAAWRGEQLGHPLPKFFRPIIDKIFWFDPNHCQTSYESEVNNMQSPTLLNVVPAPYDKRDYKFVSGTTGLPAQVDLRPYLLSIEDQSFTNSCTANAGTSAVETFLARAGVPTQLSRLFLYYETRNLGGLGGRDGGAYVSDICKALTAYGVCKEETWPFNTALVNQQPSSDSYQEAVNYKANRYERIETTDYRSIKAAVAKGFPVLIGMYLYAPFIEIRGPLDNHREYFARSTSQYNGAHAMAIVGYDDSKQYWIVANSWGSWWGDNGFVAIPYHDLERWGFDFWTITQFAGINLPDLWTPEEPPAPVLVIWDTERAEEIRLYLVPKLEAARQEAAAASLSAAFIENAAYWPTGIWDTVFGQLPYAFSPLVNSTKIRAYLKTFFESIKVDQVR